MRTNLTSKKDRQESAKKLLETNRRHMAKEAKRCGKIEKLKVLTGGFYTRALRCSSSSSRTPTDRSSNNVSLSTFRFLGEQEGNAVPRRLESLQEDVRHQIDK
ncbi:cell division cycle 5-related protein-like [Drosophila kikkawai]|uniref:Cell division cycle 5-related protein-like n=1 Tax=Drosophila kikkawai TaxID=30033 RepID=A0ABM4GP95_DROKI